MGLALIPNRKDQEGPHFSMSSLRKRHLIAASLVLFGAGSPNTAMAWGPLGHRIVASIAEDNVSGRTTAAISQIVGRETLAEGATWPDDERSNPAPFWQETASPWHYVTAPDGVDAEHITHPPEGAPFVSSGDGSNVAGRAS